MFFNSLFILKVYSSIFKHEQYFKYYFQKIYQTQLILNTNSIYFLKSDKYFESTTKHLLNLSNAIDNNINCSNLEKLFYMLQQNYKGRMYYLLHSQQNVKYSLYTPFKFVFLILICRKNIFLKKKNF